jgi:site-specific DNA-cytosine methylase
LAELLVLLGYHLHERLLCPTELGVPNRRPRYYLVAAREKRMDPPPVRILTCPLSAFLDDHPSAELALEAAAAASFSRGFRKIDPADPKAYATCFTSGYGKSLMHSGSYLQWKGGLRRFSPDEILRLLGFPQRYRWPEEMPLRKRWHLAGNSLSLFAVREVLRVIPALTC